MTEDEKKNVRYCIDNEGFDYCFYEYSDFPEIEDASFHALRNLYLASRKALAGYLNYEF